MIQAVRAFVRRWWPPLRLRTVLFSVLLFTAAMPGLTAIFLRVYENTLVRQTEAELVAQGAAVAAVAAAQWPGAKAPPPLDPAERRIAGYYRPEAVTIDLSSTPVLAERPLPRPETARPDPDALSAARMLGPVIEQTRRTTLASIILTDLRGDIIWPSPGEGGPGPGSYAGLPEVQAALKGATPTVLRRNGAYRPKYSFEWLSRASALRIHHARPVIVDGRVVGTLLLSRSPRALFRGIYEDRLKIAAGVVGIFAILVVLAGVISRGVTRPIEALSAASRQVSEGRATAIPETPATAAVEIRTLYEDFRVMAEAIDRRSRYLRDFAAAVSHEFKTPLAGIRGGVELLEDHFETMSPEERRRFLGNISADTDRLSHLVSRLLDLARADMAQPRPGVAVDALPPIRRVADAMAGEVFKVEADLPEGAPPVAVPEAAIEAVLTALIENSRQAGAHLARIRGRATNEVLILSVTDDGPGVPAADRERLFEPFFTSRRVEGGTGLGLSIACSLLAASQGAIRLMETERGAGFEVELPLAKVGV